MTNILVRHTGLDPCLRHAGAGSGIQCDTVSLEPAPACCKPGATLCPLDSGLRRNDEQRGKKDAGVYT